MEKKASRLPALFLLGFLLLPFYGVLGQKEAAIWYFGNNAGLDFRSGSPVPLLDGQLNTIEGCESFSDGQGNLLFYTDGKTVWNRRHVPMPNGEELRSSFSTSQAALVVPQPGAPSRYYVFTPDDALVYRLNAGAGSTNGFNYSIIDMQAAGGLGDVVVKNQDLLESASENVTGIRNFQGDFYWVLTHYQDRFYAYRVDAGGLDPQPVVSRLGPDIDDPENFRGTLKIAPDGSRVAISHTVLEPGYQGVLMLYDFDMATGRLSNPIPMPATHLYYGVEFSPDSSKLYASSIEILPGENPGEKVLGQPEILQFDLDAPSPAASVFTVHRFERTLPGWVSGALQLGIDKKIYHSIPGGALSVIRSPDKAGINCDFRAFQVLLGGRDASYGLPPYIQSFFETIVEIEQFCEGAPTQFRIPEPVGIRSVTWDFGDPASGGSNTSTLLNPEHQFSTYGVFEVRLVVEYETGATRDFVEFVEIAQRPDLVSEVTLVQCDIDGQDDGLATYNLREAIELFRNGNPDISAFFFETRADAEANQNHLEPEGFRNTVPGQVVYARAFENPDCSAIIEVRLETRWQETYGEAIRVPVCLDKAPTLAVEFDPVQLYAYLEAMFPLAEVGVYASEEDALMDLRRLAPGPYFLGPLDAPRFWFRTELQGGCEQLGILDLDFILPPEADLEGEAQLCNGAALLTAAEGFDAYLWDDGSDTPQRLANAPGTYTVQLFRGPCAWTQVFTVSEPDRFQVDQVAISDFQPRNRVEVDARPGPDPLRYSLDDGVTFQDSPRFDGVLPGVYDLLVTDGCQEYRQELVVGGVPAFFSPNGDGYNDVWQLYDPQAYAGYRLEVFDRYGNLVTVLGADRPGWDGSKAGRDLPSSDYWYRLQLPEGRVIQGHFALIR
ncbi:T9SS type B sorting domain-containing protein [Robiginitalea sediminis]|uniref:T9SS type B sorting domain-containing protein n=1 Tax=Robiginitalea sediminis TaxID=1982593 RepID=UPI000B4BA366|nr:T9SS type B sorting domain-containing protein [Robiginitalea sediminis]